LIKKPLPRGFTGYFLTVELIASEMQMLGKKPTGEPLERAPDIAAPPFDREE
jgi:hypothetical protein